MAKWLANCVCGSGVKGEHGKASNSTPQSHFPTEPQGNGIAAEHETITQTPLQSSIAPDKAVALKGVVVSTPLAFNTPVPEGKSVIADGRHPTRDSSPVDVPLRAGQPSVHANTASQLSDSTELLRKVDTIQQGGAAARPVGDLQELLSATAHDHALMVQSLDRSLQVICSLLLTGSQSSSLVGQLRASTSALSGSAAGLRG